jgi:hypothetical protein
MADFLGLMKQAAELKSKMEAMQADAAGTLGGVSSIACKPKLTRSS